MTHTENPICVIQGISATDLLQRFEGIAQAINTLQKPTDPKLELPELITRKDVTDLLGVSLVTLHNWDVKGILQPLKIGRKVRYNKIEVFKTLEDRRARQ